MWARALASFIHGPATAASLFDRDTIGEVAGTSHLTTCPTRSRSLAFPDRRSSRGVQAERHAGNAQHRSGRLGTRSDNGCPRYRRQAFRRLTPRSLRSPSTAAHGFSPVVGGTRPRQRRAQSGSQGGAERGEAGEALHTIRVRRTSDWGQRSHHRGRAQTFCHTFASRRSCGIAADPNTQKRQIAAGTLGVRASREILP